MNDQNDTAVASYKYDYLGRRVSKTVGADTTKYCYSGAQVIAEYDGSDNLLRKFVYGSGIDEPICMIDVADNNAVYYYHFDGLGSVAALSDSSANIVEKYSYDVFGEPVIRDANDQILTTSDYNNPYMFTGREYDSETGDYYYRARYYKPEIGRFLQPDPTGYDDGTNMYTYVHNNPVINLDPYGLLCMLREYRELVFVGGGIPHAGLILGLHEDIDFGPKGKKGTVKSVPGECPFKGGVPWGKVETWVLEITKTGEIKYGHAERPLCCCATCEDVQNCVRKTCQEWNGTAYHLAGRNCWAFVGAAKENCCLKHK